MTYYKYTLNSFLSLFLSLVSLSFPVFPYYFLFPIFFPLFLSLFSVVSLCSPYSFPTSDADADADATAGGSDYDAYAYAYASGFSAFAPCCCCLAAACLSLCANCSLRAAAPTALDRTAERTGLP